MLRPHQSGEFSCSKYNVHICASSGAVHIGKRCLHFFGDTGHNGNTAYFPGIRTDFFCKIAFGHGAEHLLRRFCRGKVICHVGILGFEETYPGRAAGGEHGPSLLFRIGKPCKQLVPFFHNGQICGKIGVKHIIKTDFLKGRRHAPFRGHISRQIQRFSPGRSDGGGHLHNGNGFRIGQSAENLCGIIPFPQRARWTMGNTLSADAAVRFFYPPVPGNIHCSSGTGVLYVPDMQVLYLIAELYTAHAFDTFAEIPDQRETVIPRHLRDFFFIRNVNDAQIVGQLLEVTVSAPDAGGAVAVVLG